jgi:TPR repeat protein
VRNRDIGDVESVSTWLKIAKFQYHARTGAITVWIFGLCLVTAVAIATPSPGRADDRPSFADLLTRAQAQAASGHRWSPPGDNMTETISAMMDLISTATPKQLADLSALLESDPPRTPAPQAQVVRPVATETAIVPAPVLPRPAIAPEAVAPKPLPAPVVIRPGPRAADLFARGQDAERQGDVSGARRLYATAADQGSATAARSLGRLYDPGYLKQTALGGIDPDPALARHWYERAVAMGDAQAAPLLQALAAR